MSDISRQPDAWLIAILIMIIYATAYNLHNVVSCLSLSWEMHKYAR